MTRIETAWESAFRSLGASPEAVLATADAWRAATTFLDPTSLLHAPRRAPPAEVFQTLEAARLYNDLFNWYLDAIRDSFGVVREMVVQYLDDYENALESSPDQAPLVISGLLHQIGLVLDTWQAPVDALWPPTSPPRQPLLRQSFLLALYASFPPRFSPALTNYLRHLMRFASPSAFAPGHPRALPTLVALLERYDPLLFGLVYEEIEHKVRTDCSGAFGEPKLAGVLQWLMGRVLDWLSAIYAKDGGGDAARDEAKKMLKPTFSRFEYHVHKTLALLRSTELFDIIVDYPDSKPALEDLKVCLVKTDQRSLIVTRLRELMARRLLHPGADTKDIIAQYIATIRCLRILDAQGVLLSRVADPIRKYLRSREDTIRCIVGSLIEEGNELVAELASSDARLLQDSRDEAENYSDPKWTPDPVDAPADFRKSKGSDIIQLLVSIYDTKDVFVKELQVMLAQRLLAIKDYGLDREIKTVEILKLRFGEASLQGLEVMIKDLQDSKRIDQFVHERTAVPLHATIVSRLFWPTFQSAPLKLPGQLATFQSAYDKSFVGIKPEKRLRWLPQLGTANLTVDLADRSLTVDVTAMQAAIIELFSEQETWTVEDLALDLRTDAVAVRNGLYFWNNHGVVKNIDPVGDEWKLLEMADSTPAIGPAHVIEDVRAGVQSVDSQQVEQMRVFWQYLKGMLGNLGTLDINRMHSMLSTLVPSYKGRTPDQLQAFLEAMAAEGLVEKSGVGWRIVR